MKHSQSCPSGWCLKTQHTVQDLWILLHPSSCFFLFHQCFSNACHNFYKIINLVDHDQCQKNHEHKRKYESASQIVRVGTVSLKICLNFIYFYIQILSLAVTSISYVDCFPKVNEAPLYHTSYNSPNI